MSRTFYCALLFCSLTTNIFQAIYYTQTVNHLTDRIVFDIDRVRSHYLEDLQFFYTRGCLDGAEEYKQNNDAKKSAPLFDPNSPTNWCDDKRKNRERQFHERVRELGRKRKWNTFL